jgi:hypothetical protein
VNVDGELQGGLARAANPSSVRLGSIERALARLRRLYQTLRCWCQRHCSPVAGRQWEAEAPFGLAQSLARCRLSDEQIGRSSADGASSIQRDEQLVVGSIQPPTQ